MKQKVTFEIGFDPGPRRISPGPPRSKKRRIQKKWAKKHPVVVFEVDMVRLNVPNSNGVIFTSYPENGPKNATIRIETEEDLLKIFGAPNKLSMGFIPPALVSPPGSNFGVVRVESDENVN